MRRARTEPSLMLVARLGTSFWLSQPGFFTKSRLRILFIRLRVKLALYSLVPESMRNDCAWR